MFSLHYVSPGGFKADLTPRGAGAFLLPEGFSGLVGQADDTSVSSVLFPGQTFGGLVVKPATGELRFGLRGPKGSLSRMWSSFAKLWDRQRKGTLILSSDMGSVSTEVRLSESIGPPPSSLKGLTYSPGLNVSLISDSGVWVGPLMHDVGAVGVENPGDVPVYPHVVWSGSGGQVVLPSGAQFMLPAVQGERRLLLDDSESCAVLNDGALDRSVWPISGVMAEPVPPGGSRTFTVPSGARLEWRVKYLNPWGAV